MRSSDLARISSKSINFSADRTHVSFVIKSPKEATLSDPHRRVQLRCTPDPNTCAVCALANYFARTYGVRRRYGDQDHLFLSYLAPFKPVSSQRISKWIVDVLERCGVDVSKFKAHSIRSAAATSMLQSGHSVDEVMRRAHWKSRSVFRKFYDRSLM